MLLADLGADVVRVDRAGRNPGNPVAPEDDLLNRGKRSIVLDLKSAGGRCVARRLVDRADALIEGFRPGVVERLGLGPAECLASNPGLVYGRMTGYGQEGPLSTMAGHDINYIAVAGALAPIGAQNGPPVIPLNMVGDFGGGGMLLAFGMVSAILKSRETGLGQVVDAAIVDGAALLTTMQHAWARVGLWSEQRGTNMLDGGAHFYAVYECSDGKYLSIGAIEPAFYTTLLKGLGLDDDEDFVGGHTDRRMWPQLKRRLAERLLQRPRQEWLDRLADDDACVAPVLSLSEATRDPHNRQRGTFVDVDGAVQPSPAPRFSHTPTQPPAPPVPPGTHTRQVLADLEIAEHEIDALLRDGSAVSP
jgi:alpha-methylacyl-CoA racemase